MKIVGKGDVVFIDPQHELPHTPTEDALWQESVVIYVWDPKQRCYAFLRIGHENRQGGLAVIWSNIWVPGFQYKYTDAIPLQSADRFANGLGGPTIRYHYDDNHHWSVHDGELHAELTMRDSHPAFNFFVGQSVRTITPNHIEASGVVNGTITFRGVTYPIENAVGHRDRSWGVRQWESIRTHRWTPAIFGSDFSLNAMSYLGQNGTLSQFGFVIRDDTLYVPKTVSICTYLEADGQTTRGGLVNFTLESGETLEVVYQNLVPSALSFYRGYPCNDALTSATCNGRTGFGVFESGGNPTGGDELPREENLIGGHIANGLFPY